MPETSPEFPKVAFSEAIIALKKRGLDLKPTEHWTDIWQAEHQKAFTVARSAGYDILGDIHSSLVKHMQEGGTFRDFKQELQPILEAKGWFGTKTETINGTERTVQLGSPRRLQIIYDTNIRVSEAQGAWEQQQKLKAERPYLRYVCILDSNTRPLHKTWHSIVLSIDDAFWDTHYPPNGWKCRCDVESLSEADLVEYDYKLSKAPEMGFKAWVNPNTGEELLVPKGIDPGFGYHIGKTNPELQGAKLAMDKLVSLPPSIGARALPTQALDAVQTEFSQWVDSLGRRAAVGDFQARGERRVVGVLQPEVLNYLQTKNINLETAAIVFPDSEVFHSIRTVKVEPLPLATLKAMPKLLTNPLAIYKEINVDALIYVIDVLGGEGRERGEGREGKLVMLLNYRTTIAKQKTSINLIKTGKVVKNLSEFENKGKYTLVYEKS